MKTLDFSCCTALQYKLLQVRCLLLSPLEKSMKNVFSKMATGIVVAFAIGGAHAQSLPDHFTFNDTELSEFSFTPGGYQGTFTYNGVSYNPQDGVSFDLTTLDNVYNHFTNDDNAAPDGNGRVIYVLYKQQYSAVIGNIVKGDADRSFVKEVAGVLSDSDALPTSDSYTYTGKVFNHIPGTEGTITYTIEANGPEWKGSGSVEGITGKRPPTVGGGEFTIHGTLEKATIVADGKVSVSGVDASLKLTDVATGEIESLAGVQYDLGVYGSNAEEIAGRIYGGDLQERVSGYGFAASR